MSYTGVCISHLYLCVYFQVGTVYLDFVIISLELIIHLFIITNYGHSGYDDQMQRFSISRSRNDQNLKQ